MNDILIKARQEINFMKELRKNGALALSLNIDTIETALNQAEENEQKLINLEEENIELKAKNLVGKFQFVKIKGTRIRLDSIVGYQYIPSRLKIHYVRINDCDYECESEKEARDFIKMLDKLLGVK